MKNVREKKVYILGKDVNTERKFEIKTKKSCGLKKAFFWVHPVQSVAVHTILYSVYLLHTLDKGNKLFISGHGK